MRLETAFRLSTYLTLVVASGSLGYAEESFLPWILGFSLPVGLLLALAFVMEGRWVLSVVAANVLGAFLFAGAGFWLAYQFLHLPSELLEMVPHFAVLLPFFGPVLMVVMLACLFLPKRVFLFWLLHLGGLLEMTLACVLASEPLFGVLLFAYLVCCTWSLSLFYLHREEAATRTTSVAEFTSVAAGQLGRSLRGSLVVSVVAVLLFLLTPPLGDTQWDPFVLSRTGPMSTGYTSAMDLNRTGRVRVSDKVAFEVYAQNADDSPKQDLSERMLWRGTILYHYDRGHWLSRSLTLPPVGSPMERPSVSRLADLGPRQFFVTFVVEMRLAHGLFLADPVAMPAEENAVPIASLDGVPPHRLFQRQDDTLLPVPYPRPGKYHYRQATCAPEEPGLGFPLTPAQLVKGNVYCLPPPPALRTWTEELLRRLQKDGKLDANDVHFSAGQLEVPPEKWEKVARALSEHLSLSGEYTYSLELRRLDPNLDPVEDFLSNVKQGHCQRFASALALTLRACQIPARVLVGFCGAEPREDGKYVVRQSHAHSWVEALVWRRGSNGEAQRHWLTLDPTPAEESRAGDDSLWSRGWSSFQILWRNFIVEYSAEQRSETGAALKNRLALGQRGRAVADWFRDSDDRLPSPLWLLLFVGPLALLSRRRWRRRPVPARSGAFQFPCYVRLLAILQRHLQLAPRPAQTPLEFALLSEQTLHRHVGVAEFADLPGQVVRLLYCVRYGRGALSAPEAAAIEIRLNEMDRTLAMRHNE